MDSNDNKETGRRSFVKTGLAVGAAAAAGAGILHTLSDKVKKNDDTVELLSQDGELIEVSLSDIQPAVLEEKLSQIKARKGIRKGVSGRSFVMVIDLARCRNARKCIKACQKMHHLPEDVEWLQVYAMKDTEDGAPYWFPKTCFHCDNAPCVKVCPVGATFKRDDNLVLIDNERCIGCKFCMAACPYSTRVFNWKEPEPTENTSHGHHTYHDSYSPETSVPSVIGTVGKCDFCPDMIREGLLPDCATACPNGVFYFGDKNEDAVSNGDETVRFSELIRDRAGYRYAEDLGTQPNVYYLPPVNRMFPFEKGLKDLTDEELSRYKNVIDIENI